jgi:hypothetical protein
MPDGTGSPVRPRSGRICAGAIGAAETGRSGVIHLHIRAPTQPLPEWTLRPSPPLAPQERIGYGEIDIDRTAPYSNSRTIPTCPGDFETSRHRSFSYRSTIPGQCAAGRSTVAAKSEDRGANTACAAAAPPEANRGYFLSSSW